MASQEPEPSRIDPRLDASNGIDPAADRAASVGSVVLGAAVGVQAMLAAMLVFGPKTVPGLADTLTPRGRWWCHPERESLIYAAGCAATVLLVQGLDWALRSRWRRLPSSETVRDAFFFGLVQTSLAVISTLAFFAVLEIERPLAYRGGGPALATAMLTVPGALALLGAFVAIGCGPGRFARDLADALVRLLGTARRDPTSLDIVGVQDAGRWRRPAGLLADLAVAALIVAIAYIPDWGRTAGRIAANERPPFFHWDYFVMAPALGFLQGRALGTEVFSQYGVAWPVLFASLSPIAPLTYGNLIGFSVIYASIYFLGLYWLLRPVFGSRSWAVLGVFAALSLQLFGGVTDRVTLWCHPSATILRMPTDVWFFLALFYHLRSGRAAWCWLAAALTGAAVLFEIDTGIYQAAILAFYWSCLLARASLGGDEAGQACGLRGVALSAAIVALAVLAGLAVASRGTLVRRGFWRDWLEGIIVFGGAGMSALPFDVAPGATPLIAIFYAIVLSFLAVVAWVVIRLRNRGAGDLEIFWGCWAAYGTTSLVLFVHRSQSYNLFHTSIPISVLAVAALKWTAEFAHSWLADRAPSGLSVRLATSALRVLPYALLGLLGVDLSRNPHFREYPNLVRRVSEGAPERGLCLMPGVCGLPPEKEEFVREFRAVVGRMATLRAEGHTVTVLAPADTIYYLASGCPTRDRYTPLLVNLMTNRQARQAEERFGSSDNDYVLIRNRETNDNDLYEVWAEFRALVERDYILEERIGSFELWRRRRELSEARLGRS
jgi:hypothetical protein